MIEHLVVWGGGLGPESDLASHRWIHRGFHETARKLGIPSFWVEDRPENQQYVFKNSTVISVDLWSRNIPFVEGARYVLHNYDNDHHPLCAQVPPEKLMRLQVWTNDASGETWDTCRSFDREARTLFEPWGSDLLAEEFMEPEFNQASRDITFVGAIWSDQHQGEELGNEAVVQELREACAELGLDFRHLTHVPERENIESVRGARLAPSFVGAWQAQKGYIACRALKNPAYGSLMFTNSDAINHLFGEATVSGYTVAEILSNALSLRKFDYLEMVREQQRVAARWTYRESLQSIERALEEIA